MGDNTANKQNRRNFLKTAGMALTGLSGAALIIDKYVKSPNSDLIISANDISDAAKSKEIIKNLTNGEIVPTGGVDINPDVTPEPLFDSMTQRIVSGDTMSRLYMPPVMMNSARMKYSDYVAREAERTIPASKPYLETMLRANHNYRTIFDLPLEFHIALIYNESLFNPNVISGALALGIAQFVRDTASGMDMKVYSKALFPELNSEENKIVALRNNRNNLYTLAMSNFKNNNFDDAIKNKLGADKALTDLRSQIDLVYHLYLNVKDKIDDDRLRDPHKSLDKSSRYLSELGRQNEYKYGGRHAHTILRLIMAYNCGQGNLEDGEGMPVIAETIKYVRKIMLKADELAPKQPDGLVYELYPEVLQELAITKMYEMRNILKKAA